MKEHFRQSHHSHHIYAQCQKPQQALSHEGDHCRKDIAQSVCQILLCELAYVVQLHQPAALHTCRRGSAHCEGRRILVDLPLRLHRPAPLLHDITGSRICRDCHLVGIHHCRHLVVIQLAHATQHGLHAAALKQLSYLGQNGSSYVQKGAYILLRILTSLLQPFQSLCSPLILQAVGISRPHTLDQILEIHRPPLGFHLAQGIRQLLFDPPGIHGLPCGVLHALNPHTQLIHIAVDRRRVQNGNVAQHDILQIGSAVQLILDLFCQPNALHAFAKLRRRACHIIEIFLDIHILLLLFFMMIGSFRPVRRTGSFRLDCLYLTSGLPHCHHKKLLHAPAALSKTPLPAPISLPRRRAPPPLPRFPPAMNGYPPPGAAPLPAQSL